MLDLKFSTRDEGAHVYFSGYSLYHFFLQKKEAIFS